jgi:predicted enzyme related to lactoylglutathione lyase
MTGMPIWYELMTTDKGAVAPFYRAVGGWEISAQGHTMPDGTDYVPIVRPDGGNLGGVLTLTKEMQDGGARPGWLPYFHVADVDQAVAAAAGMGGKVQMPAFDIEGIGRLVMITDPQGAPMYLMDPMPPAGDPDAKSDVWDREKPGHCRWNELATTDAPAAKEFYTNLLGWKSESSMPMGERGDYLFVECEGNAIGAINPMIREGQHPMWLAYLGVDSIARAVEAAKANGGTVINGPHEVPGGDHVFIATDPAGAMIGFVGPKGE